MGALNQQWQQRVPFQAHCANTDHVQIFCFSFRVYSLCRKTIPVKICTQPFTRETNVFLSLLLLLFLSLGSSQPASRDWLQQTAHLGAWSADVWDCHGNNSVRRQVPPTCLHCTVYSPLQFNWKLEVFNYKLSHATYFVVNHNIFSIVITYFHKLGRPSIKRSEKMFSTDK